MENGNQRRPALDMQARSRSRSKIQILFYVSNLEVDAQKKGYFLLNFLHITAHRLTVLPLK